MAAAWTFSELFTLNPSHPPMAQFMFATGIENSYPTIAGADGKSLRIDEMEKCGHYQHWREDFQLTSALGIEYLRYGPPLYKTHLAPGKYDWSFADETFHALSELKITPIVDLCHFGVPDWIGNFQNPDFPRLFAEYATAFAKRFPWIKRYTPVNEIFVAATFSAQLGWWNERLSSDEAYVRALKHLCQANILAMRAILDVQPNAMFIQSESTEYFHAESPAVEQNAYFFNEKRFLSLDFTYGYPISSTMYDYILDNGMTRDEYHWFGEHHVKARCIMGNDYYDTNEHFVMEDGRVIPSGEIFGYYQITKQYYDRYHLPVMHTETNTKDANAAPAWLKKEWMNMHELKRNGVPIVGFTWYSLTDQIDWDTALRENNNTVNSCGLYDLNRKIRPVGAAYKQLIHNWREILPTESYKIYIDY
jgi:beta-glucosidase/6-phospho-beta-glucosidase/beta-galactosidase